MNPAHQHHMTEEEYLEFERNSEAKHEFVNGQIMDMAGASARHNAIALNVATSIHGRLRGKPCIAFTSDQRVHVAATRLYAYPDLIVVCGTVQYSPKDPGITIENPSLIVEVLSPATEAYDRGAKFRHYRLIPSFTDYLLVSQSERSVDHFRKVEANDWHVKAFGGSDIVPISSLAIDLPLDDIYEKLEMLDPESF